MFLCGTTFITLKSDKTSAIGTYFSGNFSDTEGIHFFGPPCGFISYSCFISYKTIRQIPYTDNKMEMFLFRLQKGHQQTTLITLSPIRQRKTTTD